MKAIVLKFIDTVDNTIKMLLEGIDFSDKVVDIQHWESYGERTCPHDMNNCDGLSAREITQQLIVESNTIYPEFVELYVRYEKDNPQKIDNYGEFEKSRYLLSLVVFDYRNIEICCHDQGTLVTISSNFLKSDLKDKKIQTVDHIDSDVSMHCWRQRNDKSMIDYNN